jgi:hypothetical protein
VEGRRLGRLLAIGIPPPPRHPFRREPLGSQSSQDFGLRNERASRQGQVLSHIPCPLAWTLIRV